MKTCREELTSPNKGEWGRDLILADRIDQLTAQAKNFERFAELTTKLCDNLTQRADTLESHNAGFMERLQRHSDQLAELKLWKESHLHAHEDYGKQFDSIGAILKTLEEESEQHHDGLMANDVAFKDVHDRLLKVSFALTVLEEKIFAPPVKTQAEKELETANDKVYSLEGVIKAVDKVLHENHYYHASRAEAVKMILSNLQVALKSIDELQEDVEYWHGMILEVRDCVNKSGLMKSIEDFEKGTIGT
jgi:hypothetical protein